MSCRSVDRSSWPPPRAAARTRLLPNGDVARGVRRVASPSGISTSCAATARLVAADHATVRSHDSATPASSDDISTTRICAAWCRGETASHRGGARGDSQGLPAGATTFVIGNNIRRTAVVPRPFRIGRSVQTCGQTRTYATTAIRFGTLSVNPRSIGKLAEVLQKGGVPRPSSRRR